MSHPDTKVLFIMGRGRSGSTILGSVLGELDGFFHAGQLHAIWSVLKHNQPCGCGASLADCELWSAVIKTSFDGEPVDVSGFLRRRNQAIRTNHTLKLLRTVPSPARLNDAYAQAAASLYRGIAAVTGARVVVDSSKRPGYGALLGSLQGLTPYFVHLVRDPRAVAYSVHRLEHDSARWSRMGWDGKEPPFGAGRTTRDWVLRNLLAEAVLRRHPASHFLRVRYEDFVRNPRPVLIEIAELVGEHPASLPLLGDHTVKLGTNHTVAGNPSRFAVGSVALREDDEWLTHQARRHRYVSTATSLPLLARYRYRIFPSRSAS